MASRPGGIVVSGGGRPTNKQSKGDRGDAATQETGLEGEQEGSQGPDFLKGYQASTTESADSPHYPSNQIWQGIGASAETYKEDWKDIPPIFPYGRNFEGGK